MLHKRVIYKNEIFKVSMLSELDFRKVAILENNKRITMLYEEEFKEIKFI